MDEVERECDKLASIAFRYRASLDEKLKEFQAKIRALTISDTPVKNSKRAKHLSPIKDSEEEATDVSTRSEAVPLRPMRTARIKATNSLKEPALNSKLRRPEAPKIKKERNSEEAKENNPPNVSENELGAVGGAPAPIKRKTNEKQTEDVSTDLAKKVKLSVEHVPMEEVKIEILSDDETSKMPPPPVPKVGPPKKNTKASRSKLKEERASTVSEPRTTRTTRTKSKKDKTIEEAAPPKAVVKVEKLSMEEIMAATTSPVRPRSGTSETSSVYEDAIGSKDGTFVKPQPPSETTFVKTATPNSTFAIPGNATFQVESPQEVDGTYILPATGQTPNQHDSIMTEDRSDDEDEAPLARHKPATLKLTASEPIYKNGKPVNKPHELFNPLIQSPVKSRVQAFEKMATTPSFMSPMQRSLRPKAGEMRSSKLGSASKIPYGTLQAASSVPLLFKSSGSASKLAHMQRKVSALSKASSQSAREHSVDRTEDLKKKAAEEKKRKNEERQKLAQQQREQRELEKRVRAEAILKEKEERQKKHKQQQLEEQKKIQRLQEQKREELVRLEQQQKRMEQLQGEAIRSKHNESLQRKAIQKQMAKNLAAQSHDFSILHTDDDTDDEGKMNKRHPTPPSWSKGAEKKKQLQVQSKVHLAVIDTFFSVQPSTVNLKEIFPTIDTRKLKRNSSAVWRTPPRYSTMPKY